MQKTHFIAGLFGLAMAFSSGCSGSGTEKLPILGSREPVEKEVDGKIVTDTIYHQIPDFQLLNQDSVRISSQLFDNSVYIADFFFTSCPSICPIMQRNLLEVYNEYKGDPRVKFLSHSLDFKHDSPAVLKAYAQKLGVTNDQWQFVTGTKAEIYGLADSYMVYAKEDSNVPGGFDHSGYFLLVDKDKHIRGAYDGTDKAQVELLRSDLEILLKANE
ncbi:SCO family protein [Parapedobacter lycopersici]|uniref:SCO family protein n=1 Tax=Parapedobacter lycopersici TaxID=1864939 RepID=UPI00333FF718